MAKPTGNGKRRLAEITAIGFDTLLIVVAFALLGFRGIDDLPPAWILSIGMEIVGLLTGLVISVCCFIDIRRGLPDFKYFRYLVQVSFVGIFTDLGAWVVDGIPEFGIFNFTDNLFLYLANPTMVFFFWLYIKQLIGHTDPLLKKIDLFIKIGALVEITACLGNIFGKYLFFVDEAGVYHRGPLSQYYMIYLFLSSVAVFILVMVRRSWFTGRQVFVIMTFVLLPLPSTILAMVAYGISVSNVMCMIDIFVMYAILNIEQGRQQLAVEKELSTAASIQEGVLPSTFPLFPERKEFEVYASMDPAKEVGGDFYDIFFTDSDHLALVVGDVAGKGIPGALFMLMARTVIKSRAQIGGTPEEIMRDVNLRLFEDNKAKMFVTIWLAIIDLKTGHVKEVNAGHECPAVKRAGEPFELVRTKHDLVVGGRKKTQFHDNEYDLSPGDTIFVYTDGVPEASDDKSNMYGTDRMIEALNTHKGETPEELLKHVRESVDAFVGDADQFDDLTMMAFVYNGAA